MVTHFWLYFALMITAYPARDGLPSTATVVADQADIFDQPSDKAYISAKVSRNDKVMVVRSPANGWVALEPPPNSFVWVASEDIDNSTGTRFMINRDETLTRSGNPSARFPGPPNGRLDQGISVRPIAKKAPVKFGGQAWRAVDPPEGTVRYIRADAVQIDPPRDEVVRVGLPKPTELGDELARLDAGVRGVMRTPLEDWRFQPLLGPYRDLLGRATTPESKAAIQARIDRVESFQELANSARKFRDSYQKSRMLDRDTDRFRGGIRDDEEEPYDAIGLVQRSSKMVDGQKVFALIGEDGSTTVYLEIPAGLDFVPWEGRRVGVRGPSRYEESIRSALITVRDVEGLGKKPR